MSEPSTPTVEPKTEPVTPAPEPTPTPDPEPQLVPVAESIKYRKRAQEAEAALEAARKKSLSDDQLQEYEALRKQAAEAETKKLEEQGQYDQLLAQKQEVFDKNIADEQAKATAALEAFKQVAVKEPIMAALAAKGVKDVASAAFLLQGTFDQKAEAELVDGKAVVKVRDASGNPVTDADCEPGQTISVEQLVDGWLATPAGQNYLPGSGDSGTGTHLGGAPQKSSAALLAELDANAEKKAEYILKNGQKAYQELVTSARQQKT
jgi:hypothetical protein